MADSFVLVSRLLMWMAWNGLVSRNASRCSSFTLDPQLQHIWLHPLQAPPAAVQPEPGVRLVVGLNFRETTTFLQVLNDPPRERLWEAKVDIVDADYPNKLAALIRDRLGLDFPDGWEDPGLYPDLPASWKWTPTP